ncbi:GNAT family N-acetyltransferase [Hymenobacter sp. BT523]|uniref:GNAT family N-acetyltransferase n=1 Tax=Hymenobacter sp. BT523 TaxID=2795725 RepID=UPI00293D5F17|nr:GNAT family N-acetyltransferase [Hymenobacter sp. BT523]
MLHTPGRVTFADYVEHLTRRGKGWVAEADGRTVGFAIADLQGHSIWALFVHPDFAGQGIGRTLHDAMLNWYFSQTPETVWLSTAPGTRAEAFYRQAGWQFMDMLPTGEAKFEMTVSRWQRHSHESSPEPSAPGGADGTD